MYAQDIAVSTEKLQHFGFRSKIYAYFFLCASVMSLVVWAILNGDLLLRRHGGAADGENPLVPSLLR